MSILPRKLFLRVIAAPVKCAVSLFVHIVGLIMRSAPAQGHTVRLKSDADL